MTASPEQDFVRFCRGDAAALGAVFDALAPELLLVAAHLGGAGLAEDLVQATFLDAIRLRERWDPRRPLAPWLVGILGNHVREARRQRRRVPDPQRVLREAGDGTPADDPAAAAETSELVAAVHAAVERLPAPYRQVLVLRLVHGLELQQIAHALAVPLGTVKTQVHRGTALLRRALPAGLASAFAALLVPGRGLAAVRDVVLANGQAAVGATAVAGAGAAGAIVVTGSLLGVLTMKKILFAAAVLVLAGSAWLALRPQPAVATAPDALATPPMVVADAPAAPRDAEMAGAAGGEARADTAPSRESLPTTGSVEATFTWPDGEPARALAITLWQSRQELRKASTDEQGRVVFDAVPPGSHWIGTRMAGETLTVEAGERTRIEQVVHGGQHLVCTVVDGAGDPQPGCAVWCSGGGTVRLLGATDAGGQLRWRGFDVGEVWARKSGRQPSHSSESLPVSGEIPIRLQLGPPGCTLHGIVRDPYNEPVAGATVVVPLQEDVMGRDIVPLHATTDDRGRFWFDEVPAGERRIAAGAPGFAAALERIAVDAEQPAVVTLALQRGATILGHVRGRDGAALAGASIEAATSARFRGTQLFALELGGRLEVRTAADGSYALRGVRAGTAEVRFSMSGAGTDDVEARRSFTVADGERIPCDIVLPEGLGIAGRVVDADDRPVRSHTVTILGLQDMRHVDRRGETDAQGRFSFEGLPDIAFSVAVFRPFDGSQRIASMVPLAAVGDVRPGGEDLELHVTHRPEELGFIAGRVVWPQGEHGAVTLSLYPDPRPPGGFTVPSIELEPGTETFRLGPLPPGRYDLLCDAEGRARMSQQDIWLGAAQQLELPPFRLDLQAALRVRLRRPDGSAVAGAAVTVETEGGTMPCQEQEPGGGDYASPPLPHGTYAVQVHGRDTAPLRVDLAVAADPAAVHQLELRPARTVVLRCAVADKLPMVAGVELTVRDAAGTVVVQHSMQVDPLHARDATLGLLPGRYTLAALGIPRTYGAELPFTVPAGDGEFVVDVPLRAR